MKKIYNKPLVKKSYKGQEVHPDYKKYGIEPEIHAEQTVDLKEVSKLSRRLKSRIEKQGDIYTFSTEYMPEQLKKLRKFLINDNFICDDITENQFCYIFTEQLLPDYIKRIKWKGSKESLRYFLELLIPEITLHKNQVAKCFVDIDNDPMAISKPNRKKGTRKDIKTRLIKIIDNI